MAFFYDWACRIIDRRAIARLERRGFFVIPVPDRPTICAFHAQVTMRTGPATLTASPRAGRTFVIHAPEPSSVRTIENGPK